MSADDLERYETEIELALYREYRDVLPMFSYVVETERRFYLANDVKVLTKQDGGQTYFELELHDAWVWDMYRPARFVSSVRVLSFKDVNVEHLDRKDVQIEEFAAKDGVSTDPRRTLGRVGEDAVAAWYEHEGYTVLDRNWRVREGELDLVVRRGSAVVFCEVKTRRGDAFGAPFEAVTATKQRRLRTLAVRWLADHHAAAADLRFDVASVLIGPRGGPAVEVIEAAF